MKISVNVIRNLYVDDCDDMARTEDDMQRSVYLSLLIALLLLNLL